VQRKIFRDFLRERNLKQTKERAAVLDEVFSFHGHFEPEDLYLRMKRSGSKASRASVYRTLHLLVESGLVEKVTRTGKGNVYEHTFGHSHHDHMICHSCGGIIEFYSPELEGLQQEICRQHNFTGTSHILEIQGSCERCEPKKA
jgi:Fur family ferric uptake transcriptional regulator